MLAHEQNKEIIDKIIKQLRINPKDIEQNKKPKSVLLISAEYLPKDITHVSLHCKKLADGLSEHGINVNVVCFDNMKVGQKIEMGAVKVHYVGNNISAYSPLTWALTAGMDICRVAADIYHDQGNIDLIHAHEWSMFPAGLALQAALKKPLIVNFHSIQEQRAPGISNNYTAAIKQLEWRGSKDSRRIIVNEEWMKREIIRNYSPPEEKINAITPKTEDWTKNIVRDYSWVLKNWWGDEGIISEIKR